MSTTKNEVVNEVNTSKTEQTSTTNVTVVKNGGDIEGNTLPLKRLNEKLLYSLMECPSASKHEYRLVTFIVLWAKQNGIEYQFDDYGNLYLTKGTLDENEFYPCVTSHLDTVQTKQILYAKAGAKLDVKTKVQDNKHRIYVDGFGIGGDDKAGLVLCLNMFSYFDKLKACFFLEEETGCVGSKHLDLNWFSNVGYVIGYDSPDLNRAAYSCSGTKLMNKEFFEGNGLDIICKNHGLVDFRAEPFTDVVQIRQKTDIICMNFGTGYYNCHMDSEYCVIEDMDSALDMGVDIINKLGLTEHKMKCVGGGTYNFYSGATDADGKYFEGLKPRPATTYGGGYNGGYRGGSSTTPTHTTTPSTSTTHTTSTAQTSTSNQINYEQIQHVSEVYEERMAAMKKEIEKICKENNYDASKFEVVFSKEITF